MGTYFYVKFCVLFIFALKKFEFVNSEKIRIKKLIFLGKEEKTSVPVKTDFRVKYIPIEEHEREDESASGDDPLHIHKLQKLEERSHMYKCNFDVIDYVVSRLANLRFQPSMFFNSQIRLTVFTF